MSTLESAIAKCNTREEKWNKLTISLWGKPHGFPFRLDVPNGEMNFLNTKKNEIYVKSRFILLGFIVSRQNDYVWMWPWGTNSLNKIQGEKRLDQDDLLDFIDENPDFKCLEKIIKINGGKFVFQNGIIDKRLKALLMTATNTKLIYEGQLNASTIGVFGLSEMHQVRESVDDIPKTKKNVKFAEKIEEVHEVSDEDTSDGGVEIST